MTHSHLRYSSMYNYVSFSISFSPRTYFTPPSILQQLSKMCSSVSGPQILDILFLCLVSALFIYSKCQCNYINIICDVVTGSCLWVGWLLHWLQTCRGGAAKVDNSWLAAFELPLTPCLVLICRIRLFFALYSFMHPGKMYTKGDVVVLVAARLCTPKFYGHIHEDFVSVPFSSLSTAQVDLGIYLLIIYF